MKEGEWHSCFLWFPKVVNNRWMWLATVERKTTEYFHIGGFFIEKEFRVRS